ncbi:nuclear condensing complex subunit [Cristinia sonorae]|uniref:Nuclear condensing complex subunit n=1 Tax=Cristinia sonorae TaxID=1940300 RepID=A0A8K0UPE9_9AGAR|nr:nuclear condensing complex subunit [Cristinia sonorae]
MPARTTFSLDSLSTNISKIFDQAQSTTANHQKNLVALHKLQTEAATCTESVQNGMSTKLTGERAFEDAFINMISRILPVKKGASVADRILRFVGSYTKFMVQKDVEERKTKDAEEAEEDTTSSRFIIRVFRFLLKGCAAKDKTIRYRAVQCMAEMVQYLGQIDEDLYELLRAALLERIRDKESVVRVQAALALCKICTADEPDEPPTITDVLVDTLCHDPSPDVRRVILTNIPPGPITMPAILSRTRDVDAAVRRAVYTVTLNPDAPGKEESKSELELDATHPRSLTIAQRELIVRNGLGDREETVKAAAVKLLTCWMDLVGESAPEPEGEKPSNVVAFLGLFDLFQTSAPEDALISVFGARPDVLDTIEFPPEYWDWKTLTPERAFLARVFTEHCVTTKDDARLESSLPVVGVIALAIQDTFNSYQEDLDKEEEDNLLLAGMDDPDLDEQKARREEIQFDREVVMSELLKLAANLDYADEVGRRAMFQLTRAMISRHALPENVIMRCLDVLRKLSASERDLIRVVVEVVHELRDSGLDEERDQSGPDDNETNFGETPATQKTVRALPKPTSELSPEQKARADAIDLKCLSLCIGMLERVNGRFEDNSTLEGILGELIVPAVKRKELLLREKGLVSLGLCCLIARRMALNSFQLFLSQVQSAPEVLKLRVLQIVFDILMVNEGDFLGPGSTNGDRIVEFLLHVLENEESEKVQALLCVGISKLMLSGMITDDRVLRSLVLVYMSPETVDNLELRQCLTYFFPVFCYSSPPNQRRMQKIFVEVFTQICQIHKEWEEDEDVITPLQAGLMFVDWTDPMRASVVAKKIPGQEVDESIHIDLASDITKTLFRDDLTKTEKKTLCQLLGKLHIPETIDDDKIRTLKLLMHNLRNRRPLREASSKNAFNKFEATLTKKFEKQLEAFDETEYRQLEHLKELFEFLDDIIPLSDDEDIEPPKKRAGRKRRSESVTTDASSSRADSGEEGSSIGSRPRGKGKAKRRRLSQSDDESDDNKTERGESPAVVIAPTRVMPRRSAAENAKKAVTKSMKPPDSSSEGDDEDDEDDDEEEEEEGTPAPPTRRASGNKQQPKRTSTSTKNNPKENDDNEDAAGHDSIMDDSIMDTSIEANDDDDEDAEEVDDIL